MNQSMMKKTLVASAISLSLASTYANAAPDDLPITNMVFNGIVYDTGGLFNSAGTVGAFNPATDLVPDPVNGGRMLAPGFDAAAATGNIYSFDNFNGNPWEGEQQAPYLTNTDSWAFVFDVAASPPLAPNAVPPTSPCDAPVGITKSSGPCSALGNYDYDDTLAAMTDEQVAVGMFFNWSSSKQIAVLDIFNCDANDSCTGTGIPMENGPFSGSKAQFNAGLTCTGGFSTTAIDTPLSLDIVTEVLGSDVSPANCENPTAASSKKNPPGLRVDSVVTPSTNGGAVVINGVTIDYTPVGGFEGPDTFVINITDDTGQTSATTYSVQVGGALQNNFSMMDRSGKIFGGTNDVDIVWDETNFNGNALDANGSPTDTTFGLMTIGSPQPFFKFNWKAHHVRIFKNDTGAAITYNFDVTCLAVDYDAVPGVVDCDRPLSEQGALTRFITMTLEPGEIGGHILFDWGKVNATTACGQQNCDIDVVNKWSAGMWDKHGASGFVNQVWIGPAGVPPATVENSGDGNQANWVLVSGDVNGDGINASPMIDGAFEGSYASFNYKPDKEGTPLPPFTGEISDVDVDGFSFSLWTVFLGLFSVIGLRRFKGKK